MWYKSDEYSYGNKDSERDQIIRNASMQMMKNIADEINNYVKEKEDERKQDSDSQSCKCD